MEIITLDNGLRVALQKTPFHRIAGNLNVNKGAYHEKEHERGLSHLLEHCIAFGGEKGLNMVQVQKRLDSFNYFNAHTSVGRINYIACLIPDQLESWLEWLAGTTLNPGLQHFQNQKEIVIQELNDHKSMNGKADYNKKILEAFYEGHPRGIDVGGEPELITNTTLDDLFAFYNTGFQCPHNMDLVITGALPDNCFELIKKYFSKKVEGPNTRVKFPEKSTLSKQTIIHHAAPDLINKQNPEQSSALLNLLVAIPPSTQPDFASIIALNFVLGSGMHSRLFQRIRNQEGLAYTISSETSEGYGCAGIQVSTSVKAKKWQKTRDLIFEEFKKLKKTPVTQEEITRMLSNLEYSVLTGMDSLDNVLSQMCYELDDGTPIEEIIQRYHSLTPEKIQETAIKYLPEQEDKYVLGIYDPLKE